QRTSLHPRKNNLIDFLGEFRLAQNHPRPWPAQRLMRGRSHDLRMRNRRGMRSARHQSGKVRHIDEVERTDFIRNLPHASKIDDPRIRAAAANNQLRTLRRSDPFQFVVIDGLGFFGYAVRNDLVSLAREIQRMSMGEVSAMRQVQPKNRVAGLQHRGVSRLIGLRSRVRLHVGMFRAKKFLHPLARQSLDHVGKFASAVIALARIPLRILIGEYRPGSFQHSLADKIFRGNELQTFMLAANFVVDSGCNLRINFIEWAGHGRVFHNWIPKPILPGCRGQCSADSFSRPANQPVSGVIQPTERRKPKVKVMSKMTSLTYWSVPAILLLAALTGCTQQQPSPQEIKEKTAEATAEAKNDAKAV